MNLGGFRPEATSLPPSILISFLPFRGVLREFGQSRSPAAKHFDAIYEFNRTHKIHIDV